MSWVWIRLNDSPTWTKLWEGELVNLPRLGESLFMGEGQVYDVKEIKHDVSSGQVFIFVGKP
jgi:hypothetical protein